jgi:hypothetical protein
MTESLVKNQKPVVFKTPQPIVHIKHSISLQQYKYWVLLLRFYREFFEKNEAPDKKGFYSVPIAKVGEYIGYEPKTKELKTDFEALRKEPIIINILEKDGKKVTHGMGFISEWKITSNTIAFKIPSFLEEVMRGDDEAVKIFQLLNWNIFNSFNGKYEAIIYKLCKDYIGVGRTPYMSILNYREYIGLKENEYIATDDFNKRCIKNPVIAINKSEVSDIDVSVEYKRVGRKLEGLYFTVKHKKQTTIPFHEFEQHPAFAYAKVSISIENQNEYLGIMPPEEIEATIERANIWLDDKKKLGENPSIGGIYKQAFKDRWGREHLEQKKLKEAEKTKQLEKKKAEQAEIKAKEEQENKAKLLTESLYKKFEELPEIEKKEILEEYIKTRPDILRKSAQIAYDTYGVNAHNENPSFRGFFTSFLKEKINTGL